MTINLIFWMQIGLIRTIYKTCIKYTCSVQLVFETGGITKECMCSMVVLIPKGEGEYREIVLIEVLCKVIVIIIDRHLAAAIEFNEILHGFQENRGTGTVTLEAKLLQKITGIRQEVLYDI